MSTETSDSRTKLLEAARTLLKEEGDEALTGPKLAEAADVPIGTVFSFFPQRDDIFLALIAADAEKSESGLDEFFTAAAGAPLSDVLDALTDALFNGYRAEPDLYRALMPHVQRLTIAGRSGSILQKVTELFTNLLDSRRGELRVEDVKRGAWIGTRVANAVLLAALQEDPKLLEDPAFQAEVKMLVRGYLLG